MEEELLFRSAIELASMVRSGDVSARELVAASLHRIETLEPTINAFTHIAYDSAIRAANEIRAGDARPFAGVPIAIKDNRPVAGMPLTIASDLFGDRVAERDSFLVRRLREAGFVIVGKTTLSEMGILPTTETRRFGPTHNPWQLDRTPGGSSGGSAAAVAAGMVPLAHGNDGGGSIRIPSACCGLVGLKAARGRISVGPESGQSFFGADGILTRRVADTAAVLDVIAGYELGDANWAPPPPGSYAELARREPRGLRIALAFNPPIEAELDPMCERGTRDAALLLESLGHSVQETEPPWAGTGLLSDFTRIFGPLVSMETLVGGLLRGREVTEYNVEPLTWAMWTRARSQGTLTYLAAQSRLESVARSIVTFLEPYDALLTPALARRPVPIGEIHGLGPHPWDEYHRSGPFTPYTAIINVAGLPAIAVPVYQGDDGLPLAVQLVGPPAREEILLALATQLEEANPWAGRRPRELGRSEHRAH
ncbi:MAG: amidase [Solirubrobacteraceae bacterium]